MEPTNGAHVTWRELNLALDPIRQDLARILQRLDERDERAWLGVRGHTIAQQAFTGLVVACLAAGVSLLVAFLH